MKKVRDWVRDLVCAQETFGVSNSTLEIDRGLLSQLTGGARDEPEMLPPHQPMSRSRGSKLYIGSATVDVEHPVTSGPLMIEDGMCCKFSWSTSGLSQREFWSIWVAEFPREDFEVLPERPFDPTHRSGWKLTAWNSEMYLKSRVIEGGPRVSLDIECVSREVAVDEMTEYLISAFQLRDHE